MKKVILTLAATALLAFCTSSCNKHCECRTWLDGVDMGYDEPFEPEGGKKCSDYNFDGQAWGAHMKVECRGAR
ncbi:MAG: hypothetical protein IKR77_02670 [Bacteroidales bacterium]|nr:hypothetical protein [Bacteroidales bacterium]